MGDCTGPWRIDRYERTLWRREDGLKLFIGHFSRICNRVTWEMEVCEVQFWARRPVLALRAIRDSGKNPAEFATKEVN